MKTIKLLFIAAAMFAVGFFTSCTDDTEATGPTLEFISGDGIITEDATVTTNDEFTFKCLANQGTAKLSEFTIRLDNVDLDGYPKTDIDPASYTDIFTTSQSVAGSYAYTFIITDKDGLQDSKTITVTVEEPAPTITTYTDKILGANNNTTNGSSFASVDGTIYLLADAKTNSNKVDFVYFYGATNHATLAAPTDADVQTVFNSITTWTTKNATVFASTALTAAEFDAITSAEEIAAAVGTPAASKVNNLAVGSVVAFQTASTSANPSKKGLVKVTALEENNTGTMTVEVKVAL